MIDCKTQSAFFSLLRAGLWEQSARLGPFLPLDFDSLFQLAEEQSVIGLIAAGLEHVEDTVISDNQVLPFVKEVKELENRNIAMNYFLDVVVDKLYEAGINAILVKGQGIAQCYARPLWRASGDVDLLLDEINYDKAKSFFTPLATSIDPEDTKVKHLGMTIDPWLIELHGTLMGGISNRVNRVITSVQVDCFVNGGIRTWNSGNTDICLPSPDNDVIFIFAHFLNHFFHGGIGLRQICDWCRLLWTYRSVLDYTLLENRIREMGLITEWKAFASYAVNYLGMPAEAMPLFDESLNSHYWTRKTYRINSFIFEVGNFGHNRDSSFYDKYPYLIYKVISLWRHLSDFFCHIMIFPLNSLRVLGHTLSDGIRAIVRGN